MWYISDLIRNLDKYNTKRNLLEGRKYRSVKSSSGVSILTVADIVSVEVTNSETDEKRLFERDSRVYEEYRNNNSYWGNVFLNTLGELPLGFTSDYHFFMSTKRGIELYSYLMLDGVTPNPYIMSFISIDDNNTSTYPSIIYKTLEEFLVEYPDDWSIKGNLLIMNNNNVLTLLIKDVPKFKTLISKMIMLRV